MSGPGLAPGASRDNKTLPGRRPRVSSESLWPDPVRQYFGASALAASSWPGRPTCRHVWLRPVAPAFGAGSHGKGLLANVVKDIDLPLVASSNPTLPPVAFARRRDAVRLSGPDRQVCLAGLK